MELSKCCKKKLKGIFNNFCNIYYCEECGLMYHINNKKKIPLEEPDVWE